MGLFDKLIKREKAKVKKPAKKVGKATVEEKKKPIKKAEVKPAEKIAAKPRKPIARVLKKRGLGWKALLRPLMTEKATNLSAQGKYVFEVAPRANKIEVKQAFFDIYGKEPVKVNLIKVSGKQTRYGRAQGRTKNWKKAVITLKKGEAIELYEAT